MQWTDQAARWHYVRCEARRAVSAVADNLGTLADAVTWGALRTDSPIEAQFIVFFNTARNTQLWQGNLRCAVKLRPQAWIECPSGPRYRLDFAVEPMDDMLQTWLLHAGCTLRVGIELDGHDYHERTREQAVSRNRRDRDLAALGWRVLHFSGSELHRSPMAAAAEALEAAADALEAARTALATDEGYGRGEPAD